MALTPEVAEKLSLVFALGIAVIFLWRAYQAAIDRAMSELKEALKRCEEEHDRQASKDNDTSGTAGA